MVKAIKNKSNGMIGEQFLQQKYNLHTSKEVKRAVAKKERIVQERVSQKPKDRINIYIERLEEIMRAKDKQGRRNGLRHLKRMLVENYVIQEEDIPRRVYELEQQIAFEQGHGYVEITDEYIERKNREIIETQTRSLLEWADYLSSDDADYPVWAKYWAFRSILQTGKYNKEKGAFDKRGKNSIAPYPTLNARAVSQAMGIIEKYISGEEIENFSQRDDSDFNKIISTQDFSKIYGLILESLPEFSEKGLENIEGRWIQYEQGSDAQDLFDSLQGYPLEWCTAGDVGTAQSQLEGGDFYVYYSENAQGENKIPRVAIRMEGGRIGEVRGIEHGQEMDRFILPVVEEKMRDFGEEGEKYKKRVSDMKYLTNLYAQCFGENAPKEITQKDYLNPDLSREDLRFLYEVDERIEGFGYGWGGDGQDDYEGSSDPRIKNIIRSRDVSMDLKDIFASYEFSVGKDKEIDDEKSLNPFENIEQGKISKIGYNQAVQYSDINKKEYETKLEFDMRTEKVWCRVAKYLSQNEWGKIPNEVMRYRKFRTVIMQQSGGLDYLIENWNNFDIQDKSALLDSFMDLSHEQREKELFRKIIEFVGWKKVIDAFCEVKKEWDLFLSVRSFVPPEQLRYLIFQVAEKDNISFFEDDILDMDEKILSPEEKFEIFCLGNKWRIILNNKEYLCSEKSDEDLVRLMLQYGGPCIAVIYLKRFSTLEEEVLQEIGSSFVSDKILLRERQSQQQFENYLVYLSSRTEPFDYDRLANVILSSISGKDLYNLVSIIGSGGKSFFKNLSERVALEIIHSHSNYSIQKLFEYYSHSFVGLSDRTILALWERGVNFTRPHYPAFQNLSEQIAREIIDKDESGCGLSGVFRKRNCYHEGVSFENLLELVEKKVGKDSPIYKLCKEALDS